MEILLSVALIGILTGVSIPIYLSFQTKNDVDITTNTLISALNQAKVRSQAGEGDDQWGVKVDADQLTLFKGGNYSARDSSFDEVYIIKGNISFQDTPEIVFERRSGELSTSYSITIAGPFSESRTVTVNEKGTIDY